MPIDSLQHLVWAKERRLPDWVLSIKDPTALENEIRSHIRKVADYANQSDNGVLSSYPFVLNTSGTGLESNPILQAEATNVPLLRGNRWLMSQVTGERVLNIIGIMRWK